MTLQALAIFLVSWIVPDKPLDPNDAVPLWEKHPAEQRYLRDQLAKDAARWSQFPRSW
jgi:hypothetical protein